MQEKIETRLKALAELGREDLRTPRVHDLLHKALASRKGPVVAQAARLARTAHATELIDALETAFERHRSDGVKTDKGCLAKQAIVGALYELDFEDPNDTVYLAGARHVQQEPVWGGYVDTAANLRAECATILAQNRHPDALYELTTLAMDPEAVVRQGAAKALAIHGGMEAALLLRIKALGGDVEPRVTAECLAGLVAVEPERSLPFVAQFLDERDIEVAEGAALALGESRLEDAFLLLRRRFNESVNPTFKTMLFLPMALTRCEPAFEFLCAAVDEERIPVAIESVRALGVCYSDRDRRAALRRIISERSDPALNVAFSEAFPAS